MKLSAQLLAGSLAANIALLAGFAWKPSLAPTAFRHCFSFGRASATGSTARPSGAPARQAILATRLWHTFPTGNLPALVEQLRAAGFPIWAIRAIAQGQIDASHLPRLRALARADAGQPYWRTGGLGMDQKRMLEHAQLARERSRLLKQLRGDFILRDDGDIPGVHGSPPRSKIDAIGHINQAYQEMTAQVRAATG